MAMELSILFTLLLFPIVSCWWRPSFHQTWQWQLQNNIDTSLNVQVYDIDLFDVSTEVIHTLKSQGHKVICYFSAGSYENWRSDANQFPASSLGHKLDGWNEKWLDIRSPVVRNIMKSRMELAVMKGCNAVEPDNVDGYSNNNGFGLTRQDQKTYNIWLATTAHSKGLSIGLKNAVDLIKDLEPHYDWALNEECLEYNECNKYKPFIDNGKPVFHVEYVDNHNQGSSKKHHVCSSSGRPHQFNTLIKDWDLTSWVLTC